MFYEDVSGEPLESVGNNDAIEYWTLPEYYVKYKDLFHHFFSKRMAHILSVNPQVSSLLDIGCGHGYFLEYARKYIPKVEGIELDQNTVHAGQKAGLPVKCCSAEDLVGADSYDCIVMCDVLEHLLDPVKVLKICHGLLTPGGVLFIQVPNVLGFRLPYGHSWGLPHHIWQFNSASLRELLIFTGFKPAKYNTGVMGVIGQIERGGPGFWWSLQWKLGTLFGCGNRLHYTAVKLK